MVFNVIFPKCFLRETTSWNMSFFVSLSVFMIHMKMNDWVQNNSFVNIEIWRETDRRLLWSKLQVGGGRRRPRLSRWGQWGPSGRRWSRLPCSCPWCVYTWWRAHWRGWWGRRCRPVRGCGRWSRSCRSAWVRPTPVIRPPVGGNINYKQGGISTTRCRGLFWEVSTPAVLCHKEPNGSFLQALRWFFMS